MRARLALVGFALVARLSGQACNTSPTLPDWANCEVAQEVKQVLQLRLAALDPTKQAAIAPNSSTLADQSSAPDVAGVSVNLGQLASKSRTSDSSNIGLTVSMYGFYSAFRQSSPLDQALYDNSSEWRVFPSVWTSPSRKIPARRRRREVARPKPRLCFRAAVMWGTLRT